MFFVPERQADRSQARSAWETQTKARAMLSSPFRPRRRPEMHCVSKKTNRYQSLVAKCFSSQRDRLIVARHEVPGKPRLKPGLCFHRPSGRGGDRRCIASRRKQNRYQSLVAKCFSSQRDRLIVARHEVPEKPRLKPGYAFIALQAAEVTGDAMRV